MESSRLKVKGRYGEVRADTARLAGEDFMVKYYVLLAAHVVCVCE